MNGTPEEGPTLPWEWRVDGVEEQEGGCGEGSGEGEGAGEGVDT